MAADNGPTLMRFIKTKFSSPIGRRTKVDSEVAAKFGL